MRADSGAPRRVAHAGDRRGPADPGGTPKSGSTAQGLALGGGSRGGASSQPLPVRRNGRRVRRARPARATSRRAGESRGGAALRTRPTPRLRRSQTSCGDERGFIVVATQGRGDLAALRAALLSPADSSRSWAAAGRPQAFALPSPRRGPTAAAGRRCAHRRAAIGAIAPEEIALSILAEIIEYRRRPVRPGPAMATA